MKIISWNVNGLRSVYRKDFSNWLTTCDPDIVCLQEIKIDEAGLSGGLFEENYFKPQGYHSFFNHAVKKGYSGVGVYTKTKPLAVQTKLGMERFDAEGRILELKYPEFTLINFYIPHGGRKKENLGYKFEAYRNIIKYLKSRSNENLILAGDFNIAHKEIDLARPQENRNNVMFTEEERAQIDALLELGFVDSFRQLHEGAGHHSWWPYRFGLRENNIGWRIDYLFVSKSLAPKLKDAFILPGVLGSDHCPVGITLV